MKLPTFLHVTHKSDGDLAWFSANETAVGAVEDADEEPVVVGTYELIETRKLTLHKTVQEKK